MSGYVNGSDEASVRLPAERGATSIALSVRNSPVGGGAGTVDRREYPALAIISTCPEPAPLLGSSLAPVAEKRASSTRKYATVLDCPFTISPVRFAIHWLMSSWRSVAFRAMPSLVSVPLTRLKNRGTMKWSCKFAPTSGDSRIGGMPNDSSSFFGPMPDNLRILGLPTKPAERITSLRAVMRTRGADEVCATSTIRRSGSTSRAVFGTGRTLVA